MEKYKELYNFSKDVFKEEFERFNNIDEKASHYLSVLTLLLGVSGFFVSWVLEHFLPPKGTLEIILFILTILILITLLIAWLFIFSVLRMQDIYQLPLDSETIEFFDSNKEIDIYYYLSVGIKDALAENRLIGNRKSKRLVYGYKFIRISVILLLLFAALFGFHKWHEPKSEATGGITMSEGDKQQKPSSQPPAPQEPPKEPTQSTPDKPTPGITPPPFPRVTNDGNPPRVGDDPRDSPTVTMDK